MRKHKVITLILLGVFLVGLSLLLYPSVSNYWNSITHSRAIVDYDTIVKSLSPKDYTAYFERAEEYNSELKAHRRGEGTLHPGHLHALWHQFPSAAGARPQDRI